MSARHNWHENWDLLSKYFYSSGGTYNEQTSTAETNL